MKKKTYNCIKCGCKTQNIYKGPFGKMSLCKKCVGKMRNK